MTDSNKENEQIFHDPQNSDFDEPQDPEIYENKEPKKKGFELKAWHFILVGLLGGVFWIFVPSLFNSTHKSESADNSTVLNPTKAMSQAAQNEQKQGVGKTAIASEPQQSQVMTGSTTTLMEQASKENTEFPSSASNPQSSTAVENNTVTVATVPNSTVQTNVKLNKQAYVSEIQKLNNDIAVAKAKKDINAEKMAYEKAFLVATTYQHSIEQQLNLLSAQVSTLQVKQASKVEKSSENSHKTLVREKLKPEKKYEGKNLISENYSINTIYENIVYLSFKDTVYAVQVGDVVNGIKILKIDANSHKVMTSKGIIS